MPLDDYTRHQQGIIKRYYENAPTINLQRLSELVTDLYLAQGKRRQKVWDSVVNLLTKMEIPADKIDRLRKSDDPTQLAAIVKELQK